MTLPQLPGSRHEISSTTWSSLSSSPSATKSLPGQMESPHPFFTGAKVQSDKTLAWLRCLYYRACFGIKVAIRTTYTPLPDCLYSMPP